MTDGEYVVWSDGSCLGNPGPGGYAAIVLSPDGGEFATATGSARHSTNQRMELKAAAEGLSRVPEGARAEVRTDSKYVVDGMSGWVAGWKRRGWRKADGAPVANLEFWKALDLEASKRKVRWTHVRGHAGVDMNERCDQLANEMARVARSAK